jgi:hypothetical protein
MHSINRYAWLSFCIFEIKDFMAGLETLKKL